MAAHIVLSEWTAVTPENCPILMGRHLSDAGRSMADGLSKNRRLRVDDRIDGLSIEAKSWVGRITLDGLTITVKPKIAGLPLLSLLRYAYGLNQLALYEPATYRTAATAFQDLLLAQLRAEATALLSRGLQRDYRRLATRLPSPRGRIDFARLASGTGAGCASLPCIDYPRRLDNPLNQVLAAGLQLGATRTADRELRAQLRGLVRQMDLGEGVSALESGQVGRVLAGLDRRTTHYRPALLLIALLLQGESIALDDSSGRVPLNGFLFDMNAFFQALLSRFLRDHLPECDVLDEHHLHGVFSYDPQHNPKGSKGSVPRPDFLVRKGQHTQAILDAKYRDLSSNALPRDMLYQLAIYALTQPGTLPTAIILYPTLSHMPDQVVLFNDVVRGASKARVVLRAVNLLELDNSLASGSEYASGYPSGYEAKRNRERLAHRYIQQSAS